MNLKELELQRDQICEMMIEAEEYELQNLGRQLFWIEELIEEIKNGKEIETKSKSK
jgi:hypothetical protein